MSSHANRSVFKCGLLALIMCFELCMAQVGYSPKTPGSDDAYQPPNPYDTTPASIPDGYEMTTLFPLDSCYYDRHGFMCCNKELEQLMDQTYDNKAKSRGGKWPSCNLNQVAVEIQRAAQEKFGVDFEAISAAGDFASRNNFSGDLICKIKKGPQYILAYATPH